MFVFPRETNNIVIIIIVGAVIIIYSLLRVIDRENGGESDAIVAFVGWGIINTIVSEEIGLNQGEHVGFVLVESVRSTWRRVHVKIKRVSLHRTSLNHIYYTSSCSGFH